MPEDDADITPLIDTKDFADFVEGLIKDALDKGAKATTDVKREGKYNLSCSPLIM